MRKWKYICEGCGKVFSSADDTNLKCPYCGCGEDSITEWDGSEEESISPYEFFDNMR